MTGIIDRILEEAEDTDLHPEWTVVPIPVKKNFL